MYEQNERCESSCEERREPNSDLGQVEECTKSITSEICGLRNDLEDIFLLLKQGTTTRCEEINPESPRMETSNRFQVISGMLNDGRDNVTDCGKIVLKIKEIIN